MRGFTILELMLVLVVITGGGVFATQTYSKARMNSDIHSEVQRHQLGLKGIQSLFQASSNLNDLQSGTLNGVVDSRYFKMSGSEIVVSERIADALTITSTSIANPNDSALFTYSGASKTSCQRLATGLAKNADEITVNGVKIKAKFNIFNETKAINACGGGDENTVAFSYLIKDGQTDIPTLDACECDERTEKRQMDCPTGSSGHIEQTRTSTCSNNSCPVETWSSWVTTFNGCMVDGTTPVEPTIVTVPTTCISSVERRIGECPAPLRGVVIDERQSNCQGVFGNWATIENTCVAPANIGVCPTATKQVRTLACPSGMGGRIEQEMTPNCVNGSLVDSEWKTVNDNCTASCVANGNCCVPTTQERTVPSQCSIGTYGSGSSTQTQSSICDTPTSTPYFGTPWVQVSSTSNCQACPADSSTRQTDWVAQSGSCGAGFTGNETWQVERERTLRVVYGCNHSAGQTTAQATNSETPWTLTGSQTARDRSSCVAIPDPTPVPEQLGSCRFISGNVDETEVSNDGMCRTTIFKIFGGTTGYTPQNPRYEPKNPSNISVILHIDGYQSGYTITWSGHCTGNGNECYYGTARDALEVHDGNVIATATVRNSSGTIVQTKEVNARVRLRCGNDKDGWNADCAGKS